MRRFVLTVGIAAALVLPAAAGLAWPKYAAKEKKACTFCHVKASGGDLSPAGTYYAKNNHSLAGYDETAVAGTTPKKTGPPAFKPDWRIDLPKEAKRIAVADVTGDKKPRLLMLGDNGVLTVYRMAPTAIEKDGSITLPTTPEQFVVGRFMKDRPAIIAAPGVIYYRDNNDWAKKEVPDLKAITGAARFADNTEYLYHYEGGEPTVYGVDVTAANPLTAGRAMVMPDEGAGVYSNVILHAAPEALAAMGLPEAATKAGVMGLFDPRGDGKLYAWTIWQGDDGPTINVYDVKALSGGLTAQPIWKSPKITGKVLDVAVGMDPKEGKTPGLYVLQTLGLEDRDRMVQFYVLD